MCLAVPVKVIRLGSSQCAEVEYEGIRRTIDIRFVPDARAGEYVLLHAGFAIQKVDRKEAEKALAVWEEIKKAKYL